MRVRRSPMSAAATVGVAVALGLCTAPGASASTPAEPVAITPEALVAAAEATSGVPSRYEMYLEMSGGAGLPALGSADEPFVTGAISGASASLHFDMSLMLGGLLALDAEQMTIDLITIGADLYIRAPYFSAIGPMSGGGAGPLGALAELGDQWAYADGAVLGADAGDLGALFGASTGNPTAVFSAVASSSTIQPIGTDIVHGIPSTGVSALVGFDEIMAAQNVDLSLLPPAAAGVGDVDLPIEIWIGDNGYITRVDYELDLSQMGNLDPDVGAMLSDMVMHTTIETFDFNAPDIIIVAPKQFVDMTPQFGELLAEVQGT